MWKAARPFSGIDSSNPRRWRGEKLHHHGDVVCHVVCAFCAVSSGRRHSSYVDEYERITLRWGYVCEKVGHSGLYHTNHQPWSSSCLHLQIGTSGKTWSVWVAFSISPTVLFAHLPSSFFFLALSLRASHPCCLPGHTATHWRQWIFFTQQVVLLKPANLHGAAKEKLRLRAFEKGHKTTSTFFCKAQAIIPTPRGEDKEQIGTTWNIISEKLAPSSPSPRGLWEEEKLWVAKNINFLAIITLKVALKFCKGMDVVGWV